MLYQKLVSQALSSVWECLPLAVEVFSNKAVAKFSHNNITDFSIFCNGLKILRENFLDIGIEVAVVLNAMDLVLVVLGSTEEIEKVCAENYYVIRFA